MPKALCMTGIVVSILVFFLFLFDLVAPEWLAPFKHASRLLDILFVIAAAVLAFMSWSTLKEQD